MRKWLSAILAAALLVCMLAGCNNSTPATTGSEAGSETQNDAEQTDTTAQTDDQSLQKVKDAGVFKLGFDENFPPMGFKENGEYTGFDLEVAQEVCNRLGVELEVQPINWDAKAMELNSGNVDCLWNGMTITEELKQELLFSDPYMNNEQVVVVMEDSPVQSLADLAGKKLGIQAGSSANVALDSKADFKASLGEVVPFENNMTALMDLEAGGLDAVLVDSIVANYNIAKSGKAYRVLDESLAAEEYGIGFRKGDQALRDAVQEVLNEMAKDGKLAEISTKWFSKDITTIGK